jgi:hypothetical protein
VSLADILSLLPFSVTVCDEAELANELPSLRAFLPALENILFPNICTLSGLSLRDEGMLLAFDLFEDLRDKLTVSESRERKDEVADDTVFDLELFPNIELLFICSVYARIRSGDGGPSIAGCRESGGGVVSVGRSEVVSFFGDFLTSTTL